MPDRTSVSISKETHRKLKDAADYHGLSVGHLLEIIINISLLGLPAILKKWLEQKSKK